MWEAINTIALIILALLNIWQNYQIKSLKINVDGRLTQLLNLTAKSSLAEGVEKQRKEESITVP